MHKLVFAVLLTFSLSTVAEQKHTYPTDEIVRYVIGCMSELGNQSEENLYTCTCRFDRIAESLTYEEYDGGNIMERYKRMPGKKGGFFRDNDHGDELLEKLLKARENAFTQCPTVKRIQVKRKEE